MSNKSAFTLEMSIMAEAIENLNEKMFAGIDMYAQTQAQKLEDYMKQHRVWTDRTGEARRRLNAHAEKMTSHKIRITLAHGVTYGYALEYFHERRYAIIEPTIRLKGPKVVEGMNGLMNKLGMSKK